MWMRYQVNTLPLSSRGQHGTTALIHTETEIVEDAKKYFLFLSSTLKEIASDKHPHPF